MMSATDTSLFSWEQSAYDNFGKKTQRLKHSLDLFDDDALIALLDSYPREWLQCFTMGFNPEDYSDWKGVHIADSSGAEIMEAVHKGRFWINVINIDKADKRCADILKQIYSDISANSPHLADIKAGYSTLIISSPGIQVYYHLDAEANMLWHLKGEKQVWVYPKSDEYSPQDELEKVIAQEKDEDLPFKKSFDDAADTFILKGGDVLTWPIHSPHRVENLTVNVSLTSSYYSNENRILNSVHCANYFILKKLGYKNRSTRHDNSIAYIKAYIYLVMNKLKLFKHKDRTAYYKTDLKLDHAQDNGMSILSESYSPEFANKV